MGNSLASQRRHQSCSSVRVGLTHRPETVHPASARATYGALEPDIGMRPPVRRFATPDISGFRNLGAPTALILAHQHVRDCRPRVRDPNVTPGDFIAGSQQP
jgi:hypothetical protein